MLELAAENALVRTVLLLAIFGAAVLVAFALLSLFNQRMALRARLRQLADQSHASASSVSLRAQATNSAWAQLIARVEAAGLSLADTNNERLVAKLRAAGFTSPTAARTFTLIRLTMVLVLPAAYILYTLSGSDSPSFFKLYLVGSLLALAGLYLPNLVVQARVDRRRQDIVNGFPDCLDLMLVCVESGLGIEAAIDRVGKEMAISHPLIAELLSVTTLQMRAGASRDEAFRKLADTAAVTEIRSFTTLLIQSDKLGTSIATTLRIYAAELREKRRLRAEEKAHRLPVLISIPLVACMLPTMIGILMLPAAVRVVREVLPQLAGG